MWRDSALAGLLYIAGGSGGVWKSVDGMGSSGGYFKVRQPGVQGAPSGASYAQIGAGGSLVRAPLGTPVTVAGAVGVGKTYHVGTLITGTYPAVPAGWQQPGFNDSGWGSTVSEPALDSQGYIAGAPWISYTGGTPPISDRWLLRHAFTLGAGWIASATLQLAVDDNVDGIWLNGIFVARSPASLPSSFSTVLSFAIPAALFVAGTNVLAFDVNGGRSYGDGHGSTTGIRYKLVVG